MENLIIFGIVIVIIGLSAAYVIKEKKSGAKCIGCPSSKSCGGNCKSCSANCSSQKM